MTATKTAPGLPEILALVGKAKANAYIYLNFADGQREMFDSLREMFPAAVLAPDPIPSSVRLVIELGGLTLSVAFEKAKIADEQRESTTVTTVYVIAGEEL